MNKIIIEKEEFQKGDVLIPGSLIKKRIREIVREIQSDYKNKNLMIVCVLKGAYILVSDFTKELHNSKFRNFEVCFIQVRGYTKGTNSSGEIKIIQDIEMDLKGKDVLIVDDVIDTGRSLNFINKLISKREPASVKSFSLVDKPSRRIVNYNADFVGFEIPDIWIQGYGMDTDEMGRGDKNIIVGPYKY